MRRLFVLLFVICMALPFASSAVVHLAPVETAKPTHVRKPVKRSVRSRAKSSAHRKLEARKARRHRLSKKNRRHSPAKTVHHSKAKKRTTVHSKHRRLASKKKHHKRRVKKRHRSTSSSSKSRLNRTINHLIRASKTKARVSVYVKSMSRGDRLYSHYVTRAMTPASVLKVLTAESALIFLGANYRFKTDLLANTRRIRKGILQGDLYIKTSGDPTLTYYDLIELLDGLRDKNIKGIKGNVYIDNTAYDKKFYGPGWDKGDKKYCYGAPISASIINHNCITLQVEPSNWAGGKARVLKSSKYFYPKIKNRVVTKSRHRGKNCGVSIKKQNGHISLSGCVASSNYTWGINYVVRDVPDYNRKLFQDLLNRMGVKVYGSVKFGKASSRLSIINEHRSQPLHELIHSMLKKSDNIIAGALFKKLGQQYTGKQGSWENGSIAVSRILSKKAKVHTRGMRVLDGSGLSPNNLVTAAQVMQVLYYAYHDTPTKNKFISSLPISGVDGTLKRRLKNVRRKVRAKTGTISGVASLAGYVKARNKETLGFVIMVNGRKSNGWRFRLLEDKIVTALAKFRR